MAAEERVQQQQASTSEGERERSSIAEPNESSESSSSSSSTSLQQPGKSSSSTAASSISAQSSSSPSASASSHQQSSSHSSSNTGSTSRSPRSSSASSTSTAPAPHRSPWDAEHASSASAMSQGLIVDPHNNGARAALTNEIRAEFYRLYRQADFQVPGLSAQNILRHKDKDLHFVGHDGLRDFWKQTAATRREILQLARDGRIRVIRGPDHLQPPDLLTPDELDTSAPPKRKRTGSGDEHQRPLNVNGAGISGKRPSTIAAFTPESTTSSVGSAGTGERERSLRLVSSVQAAIDEYGGAGSQSNRIRALERERDEALRVRDVALDMAEESYRELRAVVESRGRKIRELKEEGGIGD